MNFYRHFGPNADYWAEHPRYSSEAWRNDVARGNTRFGYWDWVFSHGDAK